MGGGEVEHGVGYLADDGEHGLTELLLVDLAACLEPGTVVVALEAAEEAQGGFGEVGGHTDMVPGVSWLRSHGVKFLFWAALHRSAAPLA